MSLRVVVALLAAMAVAAIVGWWVLQRDDPEAIGSEEPALPAAPVVREPDPERVPEPEPAPPVPASSPGARVTEPTPRGRTTAAGPGDGGRQRREDARELESEARRLAETLEAFVVRHAYLRDGSSGVLPILERATEIRAERGLPASGALLLARANANHAKGREGIEEAERLFVEAILAMEAHSPEDRLGFPRIHWFVLGANIGGYADEQHRRPDWHSWDVPRSGMNPGTTPFLWGDERYEFLRWLGDLAERTDRPEAAMAAGIWTHATNAHSDGAGGAWPGHLPPAAAKLLTRMIPGTEIEGLSWPALCGVFARALEFATAASDRAAGDLVREREKCGRLRKERDLEWRTRGVDFALHPDVYWSLREEVILRFASADSEKARRLRALAENLLEY